MVSLVLGVTVALVLIVIGIHHEALVAVTRIIRKVRIGRARVGLAVVGATAAHVIEAFVFAIGIQGLITMGAGHIQGAYGFADVVYFSFATYSSLGYGDLIPLDGLRLIAGIEAVTGLVLIAWTASFTYYEMQRYWTDR